MRFAKEAWPFVLPFLVLAGALLLLRRLGWAALAFLLGLLVLLFFRHPARRFAGAPATVLAAADGLVTLVDRLEDPEIGSGAFHRVVTFLSVFDVHTQRAPVAGEVVVSRHTRGRKAAAFKHGIDLINERHLTVLRRPDGDLVAVRQIAGLLARRVVCYLQEGQRVEPGQTMGLIKFGSRVDLLVPESYGLLVGKGERLRSGETPVAEPGAGR